MVFWVRKNCAHSSIIVSQFLVKKTVTVINHPYSLDLATANYGLFPRVKAPMKGQRFELIEDIQNNVTRHLRNILGTEFSKMFEHLYDRSKLCVTSGEDYIEN